MKTALVLVWAILLGVIWPILARNIGATGAGVLVFLVMTVGGFAAWVLSGVVMTWKQPGRLVWAGYVGVGALGTMLFLGTAGLHWPLYIAWNYKAIWHDIAVSGPPGKRFAVWDVTCGSCLAPPEERVIFDETGNWVRGARTRDALPRMGHGDIHAQADYCAIDRRRVIGHFWLCTSG
ncbi:hypothetical protein [Gluconobacter morbifer]|uniref:Uncharacterized protein n=1 Tax=Gluconobacter morbifer G707 TaxID=1088869 RepID=G6XJD2_9PROT|nr:hypothetical protein [Gluconobacter morbifer]EHH68037.1 hypothetical protein GMO_18040 [Gluconobacter morbifer G707]